MHVNELATREARAPGIIDYSLSKYMHPFQYDNLAQLVSSFDSVTTSLEFSTAALVSIATISVVIFAPLIFVMIFKSERKQARFAYQYHQAQNDMVNIKEFEKASPENNFKLINGVGEINCSEPLIDELFGLRI